LIAGFGLDSGRHPNLHRHKRKGRKNTSIAAAGTYHVAATPRETTLTPAGQQLNRLPEVTRTRISHQTEVNHHNVLK
jgi:hypothetical protein